MKLDQLVGQNPRELVITGASGKEQIEKENGLPDLVFKMSSLNFLEVSGTGLSLVSPQIDRLGHLTSLVLKGNKLESLPDSLGKLVKLKLLDVSWNQLTELPVEVSNLIELQSLICSGNQLKSLPGMDNLSGLLVVKFDQNNFESFPTALLNKENAKVHLSEVHGFKNSISEIPVEISRLTGLKLLDLRENALTYIPGEVGDCTKMKDVLLSGNKLTDKRLGKLVEQNKTKQILDYIRATCPRGRQDKTGDSRPGRETSRDRRLKMKDARQRRRSTSRSSRENSECLMDTIEISTSKEPFLVTATQNALDQRRIVAVVVRNVDLSDEKMMKRFLQIQTGLHEGICSKRQAATIACHDLAKLKGGNNVTFDVKPPSKIRLLPLNRTSKEVSATELYKLLMEEAESLRKEKKRNTFSGIHKYLYLLKGKSRYCFLADAEGTVISFPPITNSETTKVCRDIECLIYLFPEEKQCCNPLLRPRVLLFNGVFPES